LALYRAREDSVHECANLIYSGKIEGKIEDSKNMLAKNMSLDLIAEITGLSLEEIKAFQAKSDDKTH
jgi:predicted transposase/invertase (TIGR01784 family)